MNDEQTAKISELLKSHRATVADVLTAGAGYREYIVDGDHTNDDSQYTLFIARTLDKIRTLVDCGINPETRIYRLNGICIMPFEIWKAMNAAKSANGMNPENA